MNRGIHEVAERGFSVAPDRYDRGRPSYPDQAVKWLVDRLGIGPGARVADLAAGTGKLTRQLAPFGADLIAIEPVANMARVLTGHLPDVPVIHATAEDMPFAGGSMDAVTIGQAFHWFDADAAWRELARVIRPGGGVGLIWNVRDRTVPWIDEVWTVMDRVEKDAPWRRHEADPLSGLEDRPGFGDLAEGEFHHEVASNLEDLLDRLASVSHVAILDAPSQRALLDEVRSIVDDHPEAWDGDLLHIRYRTDVYACTRV